MLFSIVFSLPFLNTTGVYGHPLSFQIPYSALCIRIIPHSELRILHSNHSALRNPNSQDPAVLVFQSAIRIPKSKFKRSCILCHVSAVLVFPIRNPNSKIQIQEDPRNPRNSYIPSFQNPHSELRILHSNHSAIPGPDLIERNELCIRNFLAVGVSSVDPDRSHQGRPHSKFRNEQSYLYTYGRPPHSCSNNIYLPRLPRRSFRSYWG